MMTKTQKNYIISVVNQILCNSYRVLVIEFDETTRNRILNHLGAGTYKTTAAYSDNNFINLINIQQPDIILLSLDSPEGEDLFSSLAGSEIPLLVLASAENSGKAYDALRNGAFFYIRKPIDNLEQLDIYIDKCIEAGRKRRQDKLYIWHLENELELKTAENDRKNSLLAGFNKKVERLQNTVRSASEPGSFGGLCQNMLNDFGTQLQATGGSVYLLEQKGLRLVHTLEPRHAPEFLPFPLRENSAFRHVLETGKPVLIDNIDSDDKLAPSGWKGYNDSSFMIFPIPDHDGSISGILSIHNKISPPFVSADKEIGRFISSFYDEVNHAMNSSDALRKSEARYNLLTENTDSIVFSFSVDAEIFDFFNDALPEITGFSIDSLLNRSIGEFISTLGIMENEDYISHFENLLSGRITGSGLEFSIRTASGETRQLFQKASVITDAEGFPVSIEGIISDPSTRDEADAQLSTLVEQKELLLNEINHRVKNNLQLVSSMLNLQAGLTEDEKSRMLLVTAINRVASMSLVHDNIYEDSMFPSVDITNYIEKLIINLTNSTFEERTVKIGTDIEDINLDLDRAVLCGLIINETVSNAFIHAFRDDSDGEIEIKLTGDDKRIMITVSDNGIGFKPDFTKPGANSGLGLDIIYSLAEQLEGTIDYRNGNGTTFALVFPLKPLTKRKE